MHETRLIRYIAWLPALFVAAAIFYFSAQPADGHEFIGWRVDGKEISSFADGIQVLFHNINMY